MLGMQVGFANSFACQGRKTIPNLERDSLAVNWRRPEFENANESVQDV